MTADQFVRATLARFAFDLAEGRGDLRVMKAICYVIRNRVRKAWHDGSWIANLIGHEQVASCATPKAAETTSTNPLENQDFLRLLREIDDIYMGGEDELSQLLNNKETGTCLFFHFLGDTPTEWFAENIIRNPAEHTQRVVIGKALFYT